MRGKLAKKLRKLAGISSETKEETRMKKIGESKIGYIDGTGKGNHRTEYIAKYQAIAGPRRRLYKLMKKHHKNEEMMEMLIEAELELSFNKQNQKEA